MQADLNAGGHSLTNAASVIATNVAAANLTVNGKTLGVNNALTLAGTDGSTLNVGAGGTLGSAAYTASTAYVALTGNQTIAGAKTFSALQTISVGGGTPTSYTPPAALLLNNVVSNDTQIQLPALTTVSDITESSGGTHTYVGDENAIFTHGTNGFYHIFGYNAAVVARSSAPVGQLVAYDDHIGNQSYEFGGVAGTIATLIHFHAEPVDLGSANDLVTDAYGMLIENQAQAGVTNSHGIYQMGATDDNYFAGPIKIENNQLTMHAAQPCLNLFSSASGGGQMQVGYNGKNYPSTIIFGGGLYWRESPASPSDTEDGNLHWEFFNGSFYDGFIFTPAGNSTQIGSATATGFAYSPTTLTGAVTLAVNTTYEWNGSSNATLTLPATCAVGNRIVLFGNGSASGLATISKASGQTIYFGSGTAYSTVAEGAAADSITLVCTVANTSWIVESCTGTFTDTP
jgi:hypothetical protein